MKQNYLFKTLFLLCALLVGSVSSVWAADETITFADLGLENAVQYSEPFDGGNFTVTFAGGGNDGKYYNTGSGIRVYGNGTMTVASTTKTIAKIEIAFDGSYKPTSDDVVNVGSYDNTTGVWTGSESSVVFTRPSGSGHWRIQSVAVTYEASDPSDQSVATTVTIDDSGITNTNVFEGTAAGKLVATVSAGETVIENATVTWASDNEEVATIAADGAVTLVAAGTAKLTATYAGVENQYKASSKTYTLTVINKDPNGAGSEAKPYTVAEARAAIDAGTGVEGVYATGIVSEIVTAYSSQYGNISYNISADGTTTGDQLQAFRGKSYDGANFTSEDDIKVGDVVVIYGNLTKYGETYEFAANNQLVSLTRPSEPVDERLDVVMSFPEAAYEVTLGEDFTAPVLTITEGYDGTVAYISSDETVATVAADGAVTILAAGTTTITATAPATDNYKSATASYKLTVNAGEEPVVSDADVVYDIADDSWTVSEGVLTNGTESFAGEGAANFKKNSGYFMMGKNGAYINFPIYKEEVEKIVVTGRNGASTATVMNVFVGEDAVSTETAGCVETNTYVINKDYRTVGTQYTLKVLSNHNAQITKIEIYYVNGTVGIQNVSRTNVADGEFFNLAGQRVAAPVKGLYIVNGKKVVVK